MPNTRGLGAANFLDGALRGYSTIKGFQAQEKANALQEEQLGLQREDRAYQVADRERQQKERETAEDQRDRLALSDYFTQADKDPSTPLDPALLETRAGKKLRESLGPDFDEAVQTFGNLMQGKVDPYDPAVKKAGNVVFAPELGLRVGKKLDRPVQLSDGRTAPAGSVIETSEFGGYYPLKGGMFAVDMQLGVKLPDGTVGAYNAPATEGGSMADDAPVKGIPLSKAFDRIKEMRRMQQVLAQQYVRGGGKREDLTPRQDYKTKLLQAQIAKIEAEGKAAGMKPDLIKAQIAAMTTSANANMVRARNTGLRAAGAPGGAARDTAKIRDNKYLAQTMGISEQDALVLTMQPSKKQIADMASKYANQVIKEKMAAGEKFDTRAVLAQAKADYEATFGQMATTSKGAAASGLSIMDYLGGGKAGAPGTSYSNAPYRDQQVAAPQQNDSGYIEGQTYEDADGNAAIYQDGQFVPVE